MDTNVLITIVVTLLSTSGFWSLILYFFQKKDREKTLINESLLALLHDRLYYECTDILTRRKITQDELDNLIHLYEPYRQLGGNGVCEKLMKEIDELEII